MQEDEEEGKWWWKVIEYIYSCTVLNATYTTLFFFFLCHNPSDLSYCPLGLELLD